MLVKKAGVGPHHAKGVFFRQQRQGFLEKFHYATGRATVSAPQPAVQQKVRLGQHRYQRMMRRPPVLARVRPAQRSLLTAVAFKHRGIQIQTISRRTSRKPLQLPTPQAGEKTLALSLTEALEQVANGVVDGKARDPQHGVQGHIGTQ